jgi:hypothetical protein
MQRVRCALGERLTLTLSPPPPPPIHRLLDGRRHGHPRSQRPSRRRAGSPTLACHAKMGRAEAVLRPVEAGRSVGRHAQLAAAWRAKGASTDLRTWSTVERGPQGIDRRRKVGDGASAALRGRRESRGHR